MILRVTFLFRGIIFCCGLYVYYTVGAAKPLAALRPLNDSKFKIFNKNYEGLGTTEKEKRQEETQIGR